MIKLITSIIDMWFDRDPEKPDNEHGWSPSKLLKNYRKELKRKTAGEVETLRKKMGSDVVECRRQAQEAEQRKEALTETLGKELIIGPKVKRVSSSQFIEEERQLKKQRRDWQVCLKLSHNLRESTVDLVYLL